MKKMIHTIELTHLVSAKDPLYDWWNDRMKNPMPRGITFKPPKETLQSPDGSNVFQYCLRLFVDCLEIFQIRSITLMELPLIIPRIDAALSGTGVFADDFKVSRIDYSYSVLIEDERIRKLIIKLLNEKAPSNAGYLSRLREFKSSVRRETEANTSRSVNIYDKNQERMDKGEPIKPYERDVIRFESQILEEHVKYQAKEKKCSRRPSDWLTPEKYYQNIKQLAYFDFWADLYSLPMAESIIDASEYTDPEKKRLKAFLKKIADTNADTAFAGYSRPTVKKYIGLLTRINVNPIPIPEEYGISHIESPFWP